MVGNFTAPGARCIAVAARRLVIADLVDRIDPAGCVCDTVWPCRSSRDVIGDDNIQAKKQLGSTVSALDGARSKSKIAIRGKLRVPSDWGLHAAGRLKT